MSTNDRYGNEGAIKSTGHLKQHSDWRYSKLHFRTLKTTFERYLSHPFPLQLLVMWHNISVLGKRRFVFLHFYLTHKRVLLNVSSSRCCPFSGSERTLSATPLKCWKGNDLAYLNHWHRRKSLHVKWSSYVGKRLHFYEAMVHVWLWRYTCCC